MAIDMFSMRTLLAALTYMREPITFLLDMFFKETEPLETETIDIDIIREGDGMAAFCSSLVEAGVVAPEAYQTNTVTPGYTKENFLIKPRDLLVRDPGQVLYAPGKSSGQRVEEKVAKALLMLMRRCIRREEWMAAQALQLGAYDMIGKGFKTHVDFGMKSTHKITLDAEDLFTATATSDIVGFMKHCIRDLIIEDSGQSSNHVMIMGSAAAESFMVHPQITAILDKLHINIGEIKPSEFKNGAYKLGTWLDPMCELWVYQGKYKDPTTGVRHNLLPSHKVLFGSKNARCERHFAAIQDLDVGMTAAVKYFPKSWREKDPSGQVVQLQSAPLPAPHEIDAFVIADVQAEE